MDEKDFFVGIYEPLDVRRNLLESSKEIVNSIEINKNIEVIRKQKLVYYEQMRLLMNELDFLFNKLKGKMPKSHLRNARPTSRLSPELSKLDSKLKSLEREFHKI